MKDKITKEILNDVESILNEVDIEGIILRYTNKKKIEEIVNKNIKDIIAREVSMAFESSIFKAIKKQQPIIDAFVADKVKQATIEADKAMRDNY